MNTFEQKRTKETKEWAMVQAPGTAKSIPNVPCVFVQVEVRK